MLNLISHFVSSHIALSSYYTFFLVSLVKVISYFILSAWLIFISSNLTSCLILYYIISSWKVNVISLFSSLEKFILSHLISVSSKRYSTFHHISWNVKSYNVIRSLYPLYHCITFVSSYIVSFLLINKIHLISSINIISHLINNMYSIWSHLTCSYLVLYHLILPHKFLLSSSPHLISKGHLVPFNLIFISSVKLISSHFILPP